LISRERRMNRQMVMVGFLQAQNCTNIPASWRHPESRVDFTAPEYYQEIARVLEAGKFHLAFFDDRLAMPDRYGNDHRHTVEHGIRCVKMDPITVMMVMGMATKRLGLGSTRSTTYYEPFDVARTFATIDLMTNGRAAWNVVTSMNDGEALNMGSDLHMEHDRRYERAEEFMQVVMGHWKSWDDDAIVQDRETGKFADPNKVRRIDHSGEFFKSRGPFTVPRSKQGHPVIIQAGQSGPGKRFAARWGELLFVGSPVSLDLGRQNYKQIKESVAAQGRDPAHCVIAPSAYIVSAETKMEAEDKMAFIETLATDEDALSLLSESMNFDFSTKALDEPFTDDELANISGTQSQRDRTVQLSGSKNPTPADFIKHTRRARPNKPFVGGPKEVADGLEEWFATGICDGFVVAATHVPGTYVEFVKHVIPELQRRGLYHKDYKGETLRENLGLPIPRVGD
jgi:FMN-dependent oxidoreductase (nitrilotriacetate monooxygenase family)